MTRPINREDRSQNACDFIDEQAITAALSGKAPDQAEIDAILAKSLDKQPLNIQEAGRLLTLSNPDQREQIFEAARQLKQRVYGNRIVLFAPLYIGNHCVNDCEYCAFRRSNHEQSRQTLSDEELRTQVGALVDKGHKRLILVYGESPIYDADYIAETTRTTYSVKRGHGEIRRVNINAAPFDHEGYKIIKSAGIGTFQIFHETYHHATYERVHPKGTWKHDYLWRLDGPDRAMESGIDDVGIGALIGLYDWRFDTLGLVAHANHLREKYNVGPHTISFPRLQPAQNAVWQQPNLVSDEDFKFLIAVLRLAVPYTGLILTARERPALRREVMAFGVSQIDAGSRVEIGGYTIGNEKQEAEREQFELGDIRPLDVVIRELVSDGYLPSFCTACYRLGRTGEHFMEFAIPGFIKRFCTPNALCTLTEYLTDYASPETRAAAAKQIEKEIAGLEGKMKADVEERLKRIQTTDARDLYF